VSWDQLRSILAEQKAAVQAEQRIGPVACPNDGEPLQTGPGGVRFCPFDGWRP
jgi:hypothetical protein